MGKKSQPKAPELPDIQEMIDAQARANRVDTYNPYGSQTYTEDPSGKWSSQTQFSPELQALFGRQQEMAGAAPSRYKSASMGSQLRDRINRKLGRGSDPVSTAQEYGNVEMPIQEEVPPENPAIMGGQQPADVQGMIQSLQSRGGQNRGYGSRRRSY